MGIEAGRKVWGGFERDPHTDHEAHLRMAIAESGAHVVEEGEKHSPVLNRLKFPDLSPQSITSMENLAVSSCDFLADHILTDKFENHFERTDWRKKLIEDKGLDTALYFRKNRLALKNMHTIVFRAGMLIGRLKNETGPSAPLLREAAETILEPLLPAQNFAYTYDSLSDEDKIRIVQDVSNRVRAYLRLVTIEGALQQQAA